MSDALLTVVIPAVLSLIGVIIGIWVGYRKVSSGAELNEAGAAQIIKDASIDLIKPLTDRVKAQGDQIQSMNTEFKELESARSKREKKYMGIFDKLRSRIDNLEAIVAVQGELLFILRSGADELISQLEDARIQPSFTLEHDKVVELEVVLSEACADGYSSGSGDVQ
jgi:hypothetical protein